MTTTACAACGDMMEACDNCGTSDCPCCALPTPSICAVCVEAAKALARLRKWVKEWKCGECEISLYQSGWHVALKRDPMDWHTREAEGTGRALPTAVENALKAWEE